MSLSASLFRRAWMVVPLLALAFVIGSHSVRRHRIDYVTTVVPSGAVVSAASLTGYVGGVRNLVLPEPNSSAAQWIMQTQQMLARGEWRVRRIDYENAPLGREVFTPSPYRWWLGLIAWLDHDLSNRPAGVSVERAALLADTLLQILLLAIGVILVARHFGGVPAAIFSLAVVLLYPFATGFLPGIPDDKTLSRLAAFGSVFLLLVGLRPNGAAAGEAAQPVGRSGTSYFLGAGVVGGLGLWINVADQVPVIMGIAVGAVILHLMLGREQGDAEVRSADWLTWSVGGAVTTLLAYLIEYAPHHLAEWRLQLIHPVYGVAWLGLGAALYVGAELGRRRGAGRRARLILAAVFAAVALAVVPVLMWKFNAPAFLGRDLWSWRVTKLPGSVESAQAWAWLVKDGFSLPVAATVLPLLVLVPGIWFLMRKASRTSSRVSLAVALGPVLVGLGFALWQLGRWSTVDAVLLNLLIVVAAVTRDEIKHRLAPWILIVGVMLPLLPGAMLMRTPSDDPETTPLSETEVSGLISRDLAQTLARRTGTDASVVLAPPDETMALNYYGGLRGMGTLTWENQAGIGAALRIFGAMTAQEALVRLQLREVTQVVLPSWNRYLDEYTRLGVVQAENSFLAGLRNWAPLPWLKPVPYQLPAVSGYEGQTVAVFDLVEEQNEQTILSWQAEYFAEMGRLDFASALSESLKRFPADVGALVARAQVAMVREDPTALGEVITQLAPRVANGAPNLAWERRVGLAAVLAQGKQTELAREQVRRCVAGVNEKRLRTTSTTALFRLLVLAKAFGVEIEDARLRSLALDLLPSEWRARL